MPSPTSVSPASGRPSLGPHSHLTCATGLVNASRTSSFYVSCISYHPPPSPGTRVFFVHPCQLHHTVTPLAIYFWSRPSCCTLSTRVLAASQPSETPCPTRGVLPYSSCIIPTLNQRHHICLYLCPCASTCTICLAWTSGLYTTLGTCHSHTIGEYISLQQRHFITPGYYCPCD